MLRQASWLTALFLLTLLPFAVAAQETTPPEPARVEITAEDGLVMIGDFYAVPNTDAEQPAVVLLHGSGTERNEWRDLIMPLLDDGWNVLAVDLRGFGETGGQRDLAKTIDDLQLWFAWLREQPEVQDNALAAIGSSMGTVPAQAGCAADPACFTAIAISPGDFPLLTDSLYETMRDRSILFIVGRADNVIYDTRKMFDRTVGEASLHLYDTSLHGSSLFGLRSSYRDRTIRLMLDWLNQHLPTA